MIPSTRSNNQNGYFIFKKLKNKYHKYSSQSQVMKNMSKLYFSRFFWTFIFTSIKIINTQVNIMIFLSNFSRLDLLAVPWGHHIDKFSRPSYHVFGLLLLLFLLVFCPHSSHFLQGPAKLISKGVILCASFPFFFFLPFTISLNMIHGHETS